MAASTPPPDLERSSSSRADGHPQRSRNASIGSEEASGKPEHEDAENEKRHSDESLYPPHDGVKERDRDSDTERSSEARCPPITRTVSDVHDGIESRRHVEIGDGVEQQASVGGLGDPNLVTWDGPDDPQNPKTWTMRKKWAAVTIGEQIIKQTSKFVRVPTVTRREERRPNR